MSMYRYGSGTAAAPVANNSGLEAGYNVNVSGNVQVTGVILLAALVAIVLFARVFGGLD